MPLESRAESALLPFDPPYVIGGRCVVLVGFWTGAPSLPALARTLGFTSIRCFGRAFGVVIVSDFTAPPAELPIPYREVIAAVVARRGFRFVFLPFDMTLDAMPPVDLGHRYFSLPKRFDAAMSVALDTEAPSVSAEGLRFSLRDRGIFSQFCALPLKVAFGGAVWLLTRMIDVLGAADSPTRRTQIALRPRGAGKLCRSDGAIHGSMGLHAWWTQRWDFAETILGTPEPTNFEGEN